MATSGSITGQVTLGTNGKDGYYTFVASWKRNSYSIANNTSNITVSLILKSTKVDTYNNEKKPSVTLKVNGSAKSPTISYIDLSGDIQECTFATWTGNVIHNTDGTLKCRIVAEFTHYGSSYLAGGTLDGYAEITTIPRASAITSAAAATIGSATKIKWTPNATSFYYKVKLAIGDWSWTSGAIHPNQTSAYTYTSPNISYETAKQLPDATSGTMTATLYTYSDSGCKTQVGSESSKTFTLTVPNNSTTKPSVSMTLAPVGSLAAAFDGLYVQGKTKVKATPTASGKYGASIKSISMSVEGKSYGSGAGYTSGYLAQYGSVDVTVTATDSRGFTGSAKETITVIAYSNPKLLAASGESGVVAARCDAEGKLSDSGTYLKIIAKRSYSKVVSGGVQKNFCRIRYKLESDSEWVTLLAGEPTDNDEVVAGPLRDGAMLVDSSYTVQIQAIDDIGESSTVTIIVPTDKVYMHRTKNAMGLGKYAEGENLLDVAWDAHFHGEVLIGESGMTLKEYILAVINGGG